MVIIRLGSKGWFALFIRFRFGMQRSRIRTKSFPIETNICTDANFEDSSSMSARIKFTAIGTVFPIRMIITSPVNYR